MPYPYDVLSAAAYPAVTNARATGWPQKLGLAFSLQFGVGYYIGWRPSLLGWRPLLLVARSYYWFHAVLAWQQWLMPADDYIERDKQWAIGTT